MPSNNYIGGILNGKNPFGRSGGNIQNILADNAQAQYRGYDPRLIQAGFSVRPDTMAENANTFITNWTNPNWQDGLRTIDGVKHIQLGDFVRQLDGGGIGINDDDLRKYVRDPSKVIYDEEAGLITPQDNWTYEPADDFVTQFMHAAIPAIAVASTGIGLNNAFFGGPDLGSLLGTGGGSGSGFTGFGESGGIPSGAGSTGSGLAGGGGGGTGGLFGNAASGVRGGGSFLSQLGASLGISPDVMGTLNTVRQGAGLAQALGGIFGGGGSGSRPGGSTGGGMDLMSLLGLGAGAYQDNRNIQQYESQINNLLDRGDPFRNERANYITRLNQLYADPSSIENTPGYKFAKEQGLDAIQRKMAARGMSLSGNELGEMDKFSSGLAAQTLDKERAALMQMAGANFNPADMAGKGIGAYTTIAQMQANHNAGLMNGLFGNGQNGQSGAGNLLSLIKQLFPSSGGGSSGVELSPDDLNYWFNANEYGPGLPDVDNWDFLGG